MTFITQQKQVRYAICGVLETEKDVKIRGKR